MTIRRKDDDNGRDIFWKSLKENLIEASVVDVDHRIGVISVKTRYIISITPRGKRGTIHSFAPFKICKRYQSFRSLTQKILMTAEAQAERSVAAGNARNYNKSVIPTTSKKCTRMELIQKKQTIYSVIQYANSLEELIESQSREYIGKVSMSYVKKLAKQRCAILNQVLKIMFSSLSFSTNHDNGLEEVLELIQNFLLTDHVSPEDTELSDLSDRSKQQRRFILTIPAMTYMKRSNPKSHQIVNSSDEMKATANYGKDYNRELEEARTLIMHGDQNDDYATSDDDDVDFDFNNEMRYIKKASDRNRSKALSQRSATTIDSKSYRCSRIYLQQEKDPPRNLFYGVAFVASLLMLKVASYVPITLKSDILFILGFAMYCLGFHTRAIFTNNISDFSRSNKSLTNSGEDQLTKSMFSNKSIVRTRSSQLSSRDLLIVTSPRNIKLNRSITSQKTSVQSMSFLSEEEKIAEEPKAADDDYLLIKSPFPMFPNDAAPGSKLLNCWSKPEASSFQVRGSKYNVDKKKSPSKEYLFPARGMDLFLTDAAPENIGQNPAIFGGNLRTIPTLIFNFRLPWGVVIFYFEIPDKFLPFVRSRYELEDETVKEKLLKSMTPSERCVANFFQADDAIKKNLLKIVPVVVEGPWIVKSVVSGKPSIIGQKLPVTYEYDRGNEEMNHNLYLELDLDVVSSAAGRSILSIVRGHTQSLTMDIGFVIQGNDASTLPEQMLCAVRCHGIDIYSASPLPHPTTIMKIDDLGSGSDDEEN